MDAENNPENPEQEIEVLEDDFVEVVDLDGEDEVEKGITITWIDSCICFLFFFFSILQTRVCHLPV